MMYKLHWSKAIAISIIVHMLFFVGVGYMADKLITVPEVVEQYIEMELTSDIEEGDSVKVANERASSAPAVQQQSALSAAPEPVRSQMQQPQVSASADNMSVVSAEVPVKNSDVSNVAEDLPGNNSLAGSNNGSVHGNGSSENGGGSIRSPKILAKVEPQYPESARQANIQGTVVVKIQILTSGQSGKIVVLQSSGNAALDNAALDAVQQWRFIPAEESDTGQAIVCYTKIPIVFQLN